MSCPFCEEALRKIEEKHPNADWNVDAACRMWSDLACEIPDAGIKFPDGADENHGCTCPNCGNMICGWCV